MPLMQFILLRHVLQREHDGLEIVIGGILFWSFYNLFLDFVQEYIKCWCVLYCVNAVVRHAVR